MRVNFCKLVEKIFAGKTCRLLAGATKRCHAPKFHGENHKMASQNLEICKVFSSKVSHYTVQYIKNIQMIIITSQMTVI